MRSSSVLHVHGVSRRALLYMLYPFQSGAAPDAAHLVVPIPQFCIMNRAKQARSSLYHGISMRLPIKTMNEEDLTMARDRGDGFFAARKRRTAVAKVIAREDFHKGLYRSQFTFQRLFLPSNADDLTDWLISEDMKRSEIRQLYRFLKDREPGIP